jgi:hypothetical protein
MQQSIICILDILGTKGIWTEGNVEKYFEAIEEVDKIIKPAKEKFKDLAKGAPIELDFISFSDTLVITLMKTQEDEKTDQYFFHQSIEGFTQLILGIFQAYFASSFFVRGAISFGQIEKKGSHFVGPAVDDAAEYFELPDMIGICFTPKATIGLDYAIEWQKKYFGKSIGSFVTKYKTPLKNKMEMDLYQINWVKYFFDESKAPDQISAEGNLSCFFSERNIPLVATSKYVNSIKFFNDLGENYR